MIHLNVDTTCWLVYDCDYVNNALVWVCGGPCPKPSCSTAAAMVYCSTVKVWHIASMSFYYTMCTCILSCKQQQYQLPPIANMQQDHLLGKPPQFASHMAEHKIWVLQFLQVVIYAWLHFRHRCLIIIIFLPKIWSQFLSSLLILVTSAATLCIW